MTIRIFSTTGILAEYIVIAFLQFIGFTGFGFLLYRFQKNPNLQMSYSMTTYVYCCVFESFWGFIYVIYLSIFWKKDDVIYNAYILYITASIAALFLLSIPLCVIFLSIDRMLIVLIPTTYSIRIRKYSLFFAFIIIFIVNLIVIIFDLALDFPTTNITHCRVQSCMQINSQTFFYTSSKFTISALNVLIGIFLASILKRNLRGNNIQARANRIIISTVFLTLIFDFLPHFFFFLFERQDFTKFAGPHSLLIGAIEVTFGSFIYCFNLLKPKTRVDAIVITNNHRINVSRNI